MGKLNKLFLILFFFLVVCLSLFAGEYYFPVDKAVKFNGRVWLSSWYYHKRVDYKGKYYRALNVPARNGAEVKSCLAGTVVKTGYHKNSGIYIKVRQNDGITVSYEHLSDWHVIRGQRVSKGEIIGYVGRTGRTTGTHLRLVAYKLGRKHFITKKFGVPFTIRAKNAPLNKERY